AKREGAPAEQGREVVAAYLRAQVPRGRGRGEPRRGRYRTARRYPAARQGGQQGRYPQEPGREPQVRDRQALRRTPGQLGASGFSRDRVQLSVISGAFRHTIMKRASAARCRWY